MTPPLEQRECITNGRSTNTEALVHMLTLTLETTTVWAEIVAEHASGDSTEEFADALRSIVYEGLDRRQRELRWIRGIDLDAVDWDVAIGRLLYAYVWRQG